jgi:hypothetical protein
MFTNADFRLGFVPVSGVASRGRRGRERAEHRFRPTALLEVMEERIALSVTGVTASLKVFYLDGTAAPMDLQQPGSNPPGVQTGGIVGCATITNNTQATITVGLADYTAATYPFPPSPPAPAPTLAEEEAWLNTQVYFDSASTTLQPGQTKTLYVNLATCGPNVNFNQLDVFSGESVITSFSGSDYYQNSFVGGAVVNCVMPTNEGGPFSQGYYAQQHQDALPAVMAIGGQLYTRAQLVTLLQTPPKGGDATLINLSQLITTYANLYNGSPLTSTVSTAIQQSEQVLDTLSASLIVNGQYNSADSIKSNTANGTILTNAATVLGSFNK